MPGMLILREVLKGHRTTMHFSMWRGLSEMRWRLQHICGEINGLNSATNSLELEALMLNGEGGSFAILSITFEWLYDGGVTRQVRSHVFRAVPGEQQIMDFLPEIFWLVMILILLQQELWEVLKFTMRRELRRFAHHYHNFIMIWKLPIIVFLVFSLNPAL